MRRMMLVVGIGAGLFAVALPVTDGMAVEPVIKKNFISQKIASPPPPGSILGGFSLSPSIDQSGTSVDFSTDRELTAKKNFNLPKLVPKYAEYFLKRSSEGKDWSVYEDYYLPKIVPPLPADGGKDHDDSTDRDDRRSPPRP